MPGLGYCAGPATNFVIAGGKWALRDRVVKTCNEPDIRAAAAEVARGMWERMAGIE